MQETNAKEYMKHRKEKKRKEKKRRKRAQLTNTYILIKADSSESKWNED
jgi:transcription antitermination factor NusG